MILLRSLIADLHRKHLIPVLAVLVVAGVAIPVILPKGGTDVEQAAPGSQAATVPGDQQLRPDSIVAIESPQKTGGRKLDVFKRKNPFIQQGLEGKGSGGDSGGGSSSEGVTEGTGVSGGSSGSGGSTGSGGATGLGGTSGGSTGSGGTSGGSSGSETTGNNGVNFWEYVIDVRFGVKGSETLRKDVSALTALPSDKNPVLVFLGVTTKEEPVFLVDLGVQQSGEGTCYPSSDECTLLVLKDTQKRNSHTVYRDPVRKYRIKLVDVKLKQMDESRTSSSSSFKLKEGQGESPARGTGQSGGGSTKMSRTSRIVGALTR